MVTKTVLGADALGVDDDPRVEEVDDRLLCLQFRGMQPDLPEQYLVGRRRHQESSDMSPMLDSPMELFQLGEVYLLLDA
ncbi:hypothetical protein PgNI_06598 [Pyricularia grisea]|uniref:Uncharacterized protein n=1 Tax=Pyricularia grisea TaxID=148305 RepID=A0A6P8B4T1_PYRGI|nr:hypothetical protein PgNI_06598 [Pyricularia grisea]TLD10273.1 hypothetical protein PgNI_06598 [Pyricularia grisea]